MSRGWRSRPVHARSCRRLRGRALVGAAIGSVIVVRGIVLIAESASNHDRWSRYRRRGKGRDRGRRRRGAVTDGSRRLRCSSWSRCHLGLGGNYRRGIVHRSGCRQVHRSPPAAPAASGRRRRGRGFGRGGRVIGHCKRRTGVAGGFLETGSGRIGRRIGRGVLQ